jgi:hypothetical protein
VSSRQNSVSSGVAELLTGFSVAPLGLDRLASLSHGLRPFDFAQGGLHSFAASRLRMTRSGNFFHALQLGMTSLGISFHTCGWERGCLRVNEIYLPIQSQEERVQPMVCLRCRREIEAGDKSVAVYMFAQTVGVKPRQKSGAQRICFCPQCAVSLAMGMPPEGALNMAAWNMIRDLVSAEPSLNQAAWEGLRGMALLGTGEGSDGRGKYRRAV